MVLHGSQTWPALRKQAQAEHVNRTDSALKVTFCVLIGWSTCRWHWMPRWSARRLRPRAGVQGEALCHLGELSRWETNSWVVAVGEGAATACQGRSRGVPGAPMAI